MTDLWLILAIFIFGCFIGSFLNVLIWRLPQGQKPTGRSHCPHCKHVLQAKDLAPVLSFIIARGRCAYCAKKISWRYPLMELLTGALFAVSWIILFPVWVPNVLSIVLGVKMLLVVAVLIVVFAIDYEHYLILDVVVLPAAIAIAIFSLGLDIHAGSLFTLRSLLLNSIAGAVAGFLPFYILWLVSKGTWIGLGDAKYGLFLGAVFGFPMVWLAYVLASLLGTVFSIPLLLTGKKYLSSKLPLGTFLSLGALVVLWFGGSLFAWYVGLLGY